jgi:hypothetical protein
MFLQLQLEFKEKHMKFSTSDFVRHKVLLALDFQKFLGPSIL